MAWALRWKKWDQREIMEKMGQEEMGCGRERLKVKGLG
jgi:hypothetical protein